MWKLRRRIGARCRTLLVATAALAFAVPGQAEAWDQAYGDAANSGYADVATAPAWRTIATVPLPGSVGVGAGPVIGPEGNVYVGTEQGRLMAFRADGTTAWTRDLHAGYAIKAAPAVGQDGFVYVVGQRTVRDHRVDPPTVNHDTRLYKFDAGGGMHWVVPFPLKYATFAAHRGRGITSAPPKIWRFGTSEVIMVPAIYPIPGGHYVQLVAISSAGMLLADKLVTHVRYEITGDAGSFWTDVFCTISRACFSLTLSSPFEPVERLDRDLKPSMPAVAIFTSSPGSPPMVVVSDRDESVVGYSFSLAGGFQEIFRKRVKGALTTNAPTMLASGHSMVGRSNGTLSFAGPALAPLADASVAPAPLAPVARTPSAIVVAVSHGSATILQGRTVIGQVPLLGESFASPSISRNHIFISTAGSLWTFDAHTRAAVSRFRWTGGGVSAPAIAGTGRIYALTRHALHIFPGRLSVCPRFCDVLDDIPLHPLTIEQTRTSR